VLKKQNRLKNKALFNKIYKLSNSSATNSLILYIDKEKNDKNCPTRVGFVVSKKVHKRAVKRNRIKRLLRENIRLMLKQNEFEQINKYQNLIFIARSNILDMNFKEINDAILILFKKLANKLI